MNLTKKEKLSLFSFYLDYFILTYCLSSIFSSDNFKGIFKIKIIIKTASNNVF